MHARLGSERVDGGSVSNLGMAMRYIKRSSTTDPRCNVTSNFITLQDHPQQPELRLKPEYRDIGCDPVLRYAILCLVTPNTPWLDPDRKS